MGSSIGDDMEIDVLAGEQGPSCQSMKHIKDLRLEIHACNNPSPVFKRCILSAVASTSSQGGVRLDRGGGVVTKMFPDVQKIFRTYNNFSENTVVFQIHFLMS